MPTTRRLDIDDNASVWTATARPVAPLAPLDRAVRADVVIVGAGFTGLSTAYHLSSRYPDRKVVVLEAKRVGNGASGRNGGMALHWINGVEVREDRDLIRLLATVDIDSPIPVEAFQAVAEILSYIYRKQGALAGKPETAKPQGNMK